MNKEQRIKEGLTGKKTFIDLETGEKIVLNLDDMENLTIITPEEQKIMDELYKKSRKPGFTGFTKEEEKIFSNITGREEDEDD